METVIKVNPSELTMNLLNKIKTFIGDRENIDVTISLKEKNKNYADSLNLSIEQANQEELITFTMDEFMTYQPTPKTYKPTPKK